MQRSIIDFLSGFSKSITQGFGEGLKYGVIDNPIEEGIDKFRKELFTAGIWISLVATGIFLILLGIASAIDTMFSMRGLGFVLIGLLGVVTGALVYKK